MTKNVDSDNFKILALTMCVNLICGRDLSAIGASETAASVSSVSTLQANFSRKNAVRFAKVDNIHFALGRLGARKTSV